MRPTTLLPLVLAALAARATPAHAQAQSLPGSATLEELAEEVAYASARFRKHYCLCNVGDDEARAQCMPEQPSEAGIACATEAYDLDAAVARPILACTHDMLTVLNACLDELMCLQEPRDMSQCQVASLSRCDELPEPITEALRACDAPAQAVTEPDPAVGRLNVSATPAGFIWVDQEPLGEISPARDLELPPGEHTVRVCFRDAALFSDPQTTTVRAGVSTHLFFRLRAGAEDTAEACSPE